MSQKSTHQKKRKKKSLQKRKIYLDVILLDCSHLVSRRTIAAGFSAWFSGYMATPDPAIDCCCRMRVGHQMRNFSTKSNDPNPAWNEDATFTYHYVDEPHLPLRIEIVDQDRGMISTAESVLYGLYIDLGVIPMDEIYDTRMELIPVPGGMDSCVPTQSKPSHIHMLFYKSFKQHTGMLSYYGTPLTALPYRVDEGDIFLISSSYFLTHGIKVTTQSRWDHVAMVARREGKNHLRLFEVTASGVATYYLNIALDVYLQAQDTIGIRRIAAERTAEQRAALTEFVSETLGRPYQFSPWQLIKARMGTYEDDSDLTALFCSQLTGMALKRMRLLPPHLIASNLMPHHFDEHPVADEESFETLLQSILGKTAFFFQDQQMVVPRPDAKEELAGAHRTNPIYSVRIMHSETALDAHQRRYTQYVLQVITEEGAGWELRRRYSQFALLHEAMKSLFTGIPKLPPKTMGNKLSPAVVDARQNSLEVYLDLLLEDTLTRKAQPLLEFLQVDENASSASPLAIEVEHEDDFVVDSSHSSSSTRKKRKSRKKHHHSTHSHHHHDDENDDNDENDDANDIHDNGDEIHDNVHDDEVSLLRGPTTGEEEEELELASLA